MELHGRRRGKKVGFGDTSAPSPQKAATKPASVKPPGRSFEIEPYDTEEWLAWVEELKKEAKTTGQHLYIQVTL